MVDKRVCGDFRDFSGLFFPMQVVTFNPPKNKSFSRTLWLPTAGCISHLAKVKIAMQTVVSDSDKSGKFTQMGAIAMEVVIRISKAIHRTNFIASKTTSTSISYKCFWLAAVCNVSVCEARQTRIGFLSY